MKTNIENNKGILATIIAFLIILGITAVTHFYKELFVHPTGNTEMFRSIGVFLGIGMLLKWKYTREILGVLIFLGIIVRALVVIFSVSPYLIPNTILLISLLILFYLLKISNSVKEYISSN